MAFMLLELEALAGGDIQLHLFSFPLVGPDL